MNLTISDSLTTAAAVPQLVLKIQATGMEVIITAQNLKLFYALTALPLKKEREEGLPNSDFYLMSTSYSTRNTEAGGPQTWEALLPKNICVSN